jgi:hypothetical protein
MTQQDFRYVWVGWGCRLHCIDRDYNKDILSTLSRFLTQEAVYLWLFYDAIGFVDGMLKSIRLCIIFLSE